MRIYIYYTFYLHITNNTKYIIKQISLYNITCIYGFSGLTINCWITSWCALPQGRLFFPHPRLFSCMSYLQLFFLWLRSQLSQHHRNVTVNVLLVQVILCQPCWWDFMCLGPDTSIKLSLGANSPFFGSHKDSIPFSTTFSEP